ncbi:MAG: transcription elongation factor GreA [Alphaproteobacteria bacterium]|jgi:transcription elongation factor GreA
MDKVPMTLDGYERLEEELKRLKSVERPAIIKAIATAREHGDLSENAEYHAAKERQSFNEGRISEIESKIANADIIDVSKLSGKIVKFGAKVKLADEDTDEESSYQIVGEHEADIKEGRLSITSPLARALISKTVGDSVEVVTPGGSKGYEIIDVKFK